jgi:phosphatidylglycerol:prolipoprotein diacylglycerol transferase
MLPILFRIGSHTVFSYTVALSVGMAVGMVVCYRRAKERLADPAVVLDAGFWALLGGILGGRAGYVVANWAYYLDHLDRALRVREGGLSWHGALLGGGAAVGMWYVIRSRGNPLAPDWRDLADAAAPGLALGGAFGWLGALLTGSGYGLEAGGHMPPLSWLAADLPDIYGVSAVRFLTQPFMVAWCLALWALLSALHHRLPRGAAFAFYLLLYALGDFSVAFLRGDGTWRRGLWLWQWAAVGEMCAAVGLVAYVWIKIHQNRCPSESRF